MSDRDIGGRKEEWHSPRWMTRFQELQNSCDLIVGLVPNYIANPDGTGYDCWDIVDFTGSPSCEYEDSVIARDQTPWGAVCNAEAILRKSQPVAHGNQREDRIGSVTDNAGRQTTDREE